MVCLCKKSSKVPAESNDKVLAAGWRKRAKKCEAAEEGEAGSDKCVVVKKAARCETAEDRKNNEQCKAKPKTKKAKEAEAAAKQAKKEGKEAEKDAEIKSHNSKCLSKYCADAD